MARTTEEMCRLLDERGIDYKLRKASGTSARETVYWEYEKDGDWASAEYAVTVPLEGYGHLSADQLTPEQAIAATLDGGECVRVRDDVSGLDVPHNGWYVCSKCGEQMPIMNRYCGGCGAIVRKVGA